jgi:hypothetical protein
MTSLSSAPSFIQTISIHINLAWRWGWFNQNFPTEIQTQLPRLKTLIVYDENDIAIVQARTEQPEKPEYQRAGEIARMEEIYSDHPRFALNLYGVAYGEGRGYTLIHQAFVGEDEVSFEQCCPWITLSDVRVSGYCRHDVTGCQELHV